MTNKKQEKGLLNLNFKLGELYIEVPLAMSDEDFKIIEKNFKKTILLFEEALKNPTLKKYLDFEQDKKKVGYTSYIE